MDILKSLKEHRSRIPEVPAIVSQNQRLSYQQLDIYSDVLAQYLIDKYGISKEPIVVYGHKSVYMLVCFLACVKAGRAYCPIDTSVPDERAEAIMKAVDAPVMFLLESFKGKECHKDVLEPKQINQILSAGEPMGVPETDIGYWVKGQETFYIIFTSGSTGNPKGVEISADCLNHFLDWAVGLGTSAKEKEMAGFLNQAPFSFDLSVMDIYTCLACGATLYTLEKEVQSDYRRMFEMMKSAGIKVWVSTPSFADICLADKAFSQELMPQLQTFLFCGETLTNKTALQLLDRFPHASVINTYGPTESTVALTDVKVDKELAETVSPLPVGKAKQGSIIEIWDTGGAVLSEGEIGEIVLIGDTVSTGYFRQEELTQKAFFHCERNGKQYRGYHTGDAGYLKGGMLYYNGRMDLQIKLHGYRIELEDIEQNILKIKHVEQAVVTPNQKDGKVSSLTAHLVYRGDMNDIRAAARKLKEQMKNYLPDYMVPKKICFLTSMPLSANGKADRRKLGGMGC